MKTRRHIYGGMMTAAALLCLAGCKKDEGEKVVLGVDFEQTAGMQKTYIGNGDRTIYWSTENEDQVMVNDDVYTVHDGVVEVNMCDDGYAAVYPVQEGNTLTYSTDEHNGKNCTGGTVVIPATQTYIADANGVQQLNAPMAARLDSRTGRLLFRNLYAVIKVTVEPDHNFTLHNIQITADAQNLAGTQSFTFSAATNTASPTLGTLTTTSKSVTLTGIDSFIPVGERAAFYLYTAAPVDESKLTVTLNGSESLKYEKTKPGGINIPRSALGATTIAVNMAVDLGLPSGILWATCNVGASKPDDFGDYFAWGETQPYYTELNSDGSAIDWREGKGSGYCLETYCGHPTAFQEWTTKPYDESNVLLSANDAANRNWGGNWRTPTKTEFDELLNSDNCTWEWQDNYNGGHKGFLVTSKIDGYTDKAIFLPAAGRYQNTSMEHRNGRLYYSSSSLRGDRDHWYLRYDGVSKMDGYGYRDMGFSVRPVMPK